MSVERPPAAPAGTRGQSAVALAIAAAWGGLYIWRTLVGHYSLGTNAYDLSVFDYALAGILRGTGGFIPFLGHSIFSHHFMPVLYVVAPFYAVFPGAVFLLLLQRFVIGAAGFLFYRLQRHFGLDHLPALVLMLVFLMSRRTHSALAGFFYPECLQALLTFAIVAFWSSRAWGYWTCVVLMLMTKEDAAIYVAAFGVWQLLRATDRPRRALITAALAAAWFTIALVVAIPFSRRHDGLPVVNPLLESRWGSPEAGVRPLELVQRLASPTTAGRLVNMLAMVGGLPAFGGSWLLPALPGLAINMSAEPTSMQAALTDHYAWPVLPWLLLSAAAGALWLQRRWPRVARVWLLLLLAATLLDNPAMRRIGRTRVDPQAREALRQLSGLSGRIILAQGNLVPHLPHSSGMFVVGSNLEPDPARPPDLVLLAPVGNDWPLGRDRLLTLIGEYQQNPNYEQIRGGPLFAFRRVTAPPRGSAGTR